VSRPPEDRGGELRALFFESANELLQSLNEAGLELEARPADEEVIRRVRRAGAYLEGRFGSLWISQLSELAHELEDALTPQIAHARGADFAELVLTAADSFGAMLTAYPTEGRAARRGSPSRHYSEIAGWAGFPEECGPGAASIAAQFAWTEYEQLMISEAVHRGETVYNVALRNRSQQPDARRRFPAHSNVLHGSGNVIALRPEDNVGRRNRGNCRSGPGKLPARRKTSPALPDSFDCLDVRLERASTAGDHRTMNCSVICWRRRRRNLSPGPPKPPKAAQQLIPVLPVPRQLRWPKARFAWMPPASMRS